MPSPLNFPVVGIGCSAGGLDALERFLRPLPAQSGLAFVVIQHLDPSHASLLPELLARFSPLPVVEAADGLALQADHLYVIPPNQDLSLRQGRLQLNPPQLLGGLRLPVDFFLRSLAEDRGEQAIGLILSGMGSDGLLGLRSIKEAGGLTLAQEPASAQSPSMPQSAIDAGLVDIIAAAEDLAARLIDSISYPHQPMQQPTSDEPEVMTQILRLLRGHSGNDFSQYKRNSLQRRIERRMAVHQLDRIDAYLRLLQTNSQELELLFKELLIGVTRFFRDPEVWPILAQQALPQLLAAHPAGADLRAWVPACSTGEEAYSLAILFQECLQQLQPEGRFRLQIYATDLDPEAIERARRGVYAQNIAADVSAERLARWFVAEEDGGYRIRKEIREMLVFAVQNIISDPPFGKLDLLSCRNLLIYFDTPLQHRLLPLFYYALKPGGLLLLGNAEAVGQHSNLFSPLPNPAGHRARLYQRANQTLSLNELPLPQLPADPPGISPPAQGPAHEDLGQLTDQLIQQQFAPAAVLVNAEGDILYISGRTGKYLEPAAGHTNVNIHAMAREGLREALVGLIARALAESRPIELRGLRVVGDGGGAEMIDLSALALRQPKALSGRVLLVFKDVAKVCRRRAGQQVSAETHSALEQELLQAREALQIAQEEMQTTVEELKSSNEELQSTNEELQSANEELTTSREEMQSLNEELQTVNAELQARVEDLTSVRNDMTNLLNSTEIATVFLDSQMQLRRYTPHATQLFKLIPSDIGRPLSDLNSDLNYAQLRDDALEVLRSLVFQEKILATHDGRWYRVRIMPYRTQDNLIDGVVITFIDITAIKQLEARLRAHELD
jgi:chemotaxis methyl-accepting protein methylase